MACNTKINVEERSELKATEWAYFMLIFVFYVHKISINTDKTIQ